MNFVHQWITNGSLTTICSLIQSCDFNSFLHYFTQTANVSPTGIVVLRL